MILICTRTRGSDPQPWSIGTALSPAELFGQGGGGGGNLIKTKHTLTTQLRSPTAGNLPRRSENFCSHRFIAAVFIIAKIQEEVARIHYHYATESPLAKKKKKASTGTQLALEQHGFEWRRSPYTSIFLKKLNTCILSICWEPGCRGLTVCIDLCHIGRGLECPWTSVSEGVLEPALCGY